MADEPPAAVQPEGRTDSEATLIGGLTGGDNHVPQGEQSTQGVADMQSLVDSTGPSEAAGEQPNSGGSGLDASVFDSVSLGSGACTPAVPLDAPGRVDPTTQPAEAAPDAQSALEYEHESSTNRAPDTIASDAADAPHAAAAEPGHDTSERTVIQDTDAPETPEKAADTQDIQDADTQVHTPSEERAPSSADRRQESLPPTPKSTAPSVHSESGANSLTRGSSVFVVSALETIIASKEAKRSKELKESATAALDMVRRATSPEHAALDPSVVFEPLRLSCASKSVPLQTVSLDCISKLVNYAFFADDSGESGKTVADMVVNTVCDCFDESMDERVAVQIVKALLACVLSTSIRAHQSTLLRAVRTVYNIFLMSRTPANQAISQGSLAQMINYVFSRVPRQNGDVVPVPESAEPVTLESIENRRSFEGANERDDGTQIAPTSIDAPDLLVKDAFLVLRALCKLSMKPLGTESERDLRSHAMRSKLLSLSMIHDVLKNHMDIFTDDSVRINSATTGEPTAFVHAVKQYICITLSRNAVSSVLPVFEASCEIFWLVLAGMRAKVKKEIEVLLNEIFLPILEMRNSTSAQKTILLGIFHRLCSDPQALVELYLNYDCDRAALENVYERLMNVISRLSQLPSEEEGTESHLRKASLDCLCSTLHSLVTWAGRDRPAEPEHEPQTAVELERHVPDTAADDDDPSRFEDAKARKTTLLEAIRKFNEKPKKGIEDLLKHGFIRSRAPQDIARFLFYADGLNKTNIGEYLGEGDAENIAIMHAFVDLMDFSGLPFTSALRRFLQAFRLPGEAQKIDRYMLKFAERYVAGNKDAFANADTAYVLAYSVIMLNTDAHNPQVKHRMSLQDFIKNNSGIDDNKDLPEEFLSAIYDEIQRHEIKMQDEVAAPPAPQSGLASAIATVGRDLQREAYILQSESMVNRTEVLFRTMLYAQRRGAPNAAAQYYSASHIEHVKPMFEVAWMAFLAGISTPLQDSTDPETVHTALEGFRDSIKIVCFFGLELERNAFVTTLAKFTFLNNLGEMKSKNVETIKVLLGIAHAEGNYLHGSWREVLTCVSQLERFQLISGGLDERTLPELGRRSASGAPRALPNQDVVVAGGSSEITVASDRVFSSTPSLSGEAIVEFVQALCGVSWEEIQSSGKSENPRLFSLQKLVEISYYNMGRIRMEWSRLWAILGEHFNMVCCHPNNAVSAFGLDSLRQLAVKFLEKEELAHFKFQKDFLKPFQHAMRRNPDVGAKEMVLQCLEQMVQTRSENIRSGWCTMLGVFGAAASQSVRVALYAFDLVRRIRTEHIGALIRADSFADLCVCAAHFAKTGDQKVSLQATELLQSLVNDVDSGTPQERIWLPVLVALYDIVMTGDDLEVRRVALDGLFSLLHEHGATFAPEFWDTVCDDVLFPIFNVLRNRSDVLRFNSQEDMSVWLSTTMIQALRKLVTLWTAYFDILERRLPGLLELLCSCICQENDTLARIGTSCLQQLVVLNVDRFDDARWNATVDAFVRLFRATTASQVFDPALSAPEAPGSMGAVERRQAFKRIIVKCVLQLLLIETTHELLQHAAVYEAMPIDQLLRLTAALEDSYRFARRFNADRPLRTALWRVGFMRQLPNLLKQESTSAGTLVHVYLRMQRDARASVEGRQAQITERFAPLAEEIMSVFLPLDNETQARNIAAWTPVVAQVLLGLAALYDTQAFRTNKEACAQYTQTFYPLAIELFDKASLAPQLTVPLLRYLSAVGVAHGFIDLEAAAERTRQREEAKARELAQLHAQQAAGLYSVRGGEASRDDVGSTGEMFRQVNASTDALRTFESRQQSPAPEQQHARANEHEHEHNTPHEAQPSPAASA
ncbi:guanine nucleotide exchange protein for ADP-robosylation factor [Malassezia cuniculi]|uniref:Guanine nucleotide exchange protein for ADP-robosylation factor n=1 Tax=Malassezia cuniculi TaxID=948313 RepID=A0AAF0EYZ7_9BASI|nr:guanine nucleotide exchange protein for ADP-robosylation factor [Malassezia cuniculi]